MIVKGTLSSTHLGAFRSCIDELLHGSHRRITLDFTRCRYLSSLFIGYLVDGILNAKDDGREVEVFVSSEINQFLRMAQLHHLFNFTEAEPTRSAMGSGIAPAVAT